MAFSFDRRNQVNPDQARIDENRARMAEESRIINEVMGHLLNGASIEDASNQVEGTTIEQVQAWMAEGRITNPKYFDQPYRATDADLH